MMITTLVAVRLSWRSGDMRSVAAVRADQRRGGIVLPYRISYVGDWYDAGEQEWSETNHLPESYCRDYPAFPQTGSKPSMIDLISWSE